MKSTSKRFVALVALAATTSLAGCSLAGEPASTSTAEPVVLVTHDSFAVSDDVKQAMEQAAGAPVVFQAPGDGGELVNQLILTKDAPLGDAVYGIDNTYASAAVDAGVLAPHAVANAPARVTGDVGGQLTAVDYSDVCVNYDKAYFADKGLAAPATLADLAKPEYKDLLVVTNPATSSPGMAFLLATVAEFGDGWQDYWTSLKTNGVKVASGWSDAYYVDFSGSEGKGDRPLVLSYASSPPVEVGDGETEAPTAALLDTCYRQVEYAGVIAGAKHPEQAAKLVDFLLSPEFQADLPDQMYVYPAVVATPLPDAWQQFAPLSETPYSVPAADVAAHRKEWVEEWAQLVL